MTAIGGIVAIIAALVMLVGGIMWIIEMFKTSVVWGVCGILVPFASLVWLFMNWEAGKKPFLISLGGGLLYGLSIGLIAAGGGFGH